MNNEKKHSEYIELFEKPLLSKEMRELIYNFIYFKAIRDASIRDKRFFVEEIVQETFIRALKNSDKYTLGTNLEWWIKKIAFHIFIDYKRKNKKFKLVETLDEDADAFYNIKSPYDVHSILYKHDISIETTRLLKWAIEELPQVLRDVAVLRVYWECSFKEIAWITNSNLNTTLWRMRYVLDNLRKNPLISEELY